MFEQVLGVLAGVNPTVAPVPIGMAASASAQHFALVALSVVVGLMVIAALVMWRRTGRPTGLLLLLGGALCSLNEAPVDVLGQVYIPKADWTAYTIYDRAMPVWVVLCYIAVFGGLAYITLLAIQSGASRRKLWYSVGFVWAMNVLLEIPLLASGIYAYYGEQTFPIAGFPLNWLVINSVGILLTATVADRFAQFFTGARALLLVLVPQVTFMASWSLGAAHFFTTSSDSPAPVKWIGSAVAAVVGLVAIDFMIKTSARKREAVRDGDLCVPQMSI